MSTNRFVIFTVMVGKYGDIYQPKCVDKRFDYILFSDIVSEDNLGVWQVRRIKNSRELDNKRLSRYPKTHSVELLSQYEASLYIDANIQIVDEWVYSRFIDLVDTNVFLAGVKLVSTGRDCIYRHSYDMCVVKAEHDYNAIEQMHALYQKGFPEHFGLNENNLIFRRHCGVVAEVENEWWQWIRKYSYRDQFSFMYCLWKYNIPRVLFLPDGEDTGSSKHFIRHSHNDIPEVASQKWVKTGLFETIRNIIRQQPNCYNKYCEQWVKLRVLPFPKLSLLIWEGIAIFYQAPRYVARKLKRIHE